MGEPYDVPFLDCKNHPTCFILLCEPSHANDQNMMKHTIFFIGVAISLTGCNLFDRADPPKSDNDPPKDMMIADMSDLSDETPDLQVDMPRDMKPVDMSSKDISDEMGDMMMDMRIDDDMPDMMMDMIVDMGDLCGNGKLDGEERCDDNNKTDKDGCTSTCTIEDGWVCPIVGRTQSCVRVTGIDHSDKTKIASPTLPKEGAVTDSISCAKPNFVIAVQGFTDTRHGIGRTSVQCAGLKVELDGAITQGNGSSLNDFLELPSYANFDAVNCPAGMFLSGATVHYKTTFGHAREVTGIQPRCNTLAIKDGKLTRINSSASRTLYGQMGTKSYTVECDEGDIATGLLGDIQAEREGDYLNRLSLRCTTASLLTK